MSALDPLGARCVSPSFPTEPGRAGERKPAPSQTFAGPDRRAAESARAERRKTAGQRGGVARASSRPALMRRLERSPASLIPAAVSRRRRARPRARPLPSILQPEKGRGLWPPTRTNSKSRSATQSRFLAKRPETLVVAISRVDGVRIPDRCPRLPRARPIGRLGARDRIGSRQGSRRRVVSPFSTVETDSREPDRPASSQRRNVHLHELTTLATRGGRPLRHAALARLGSTT